MHICCAPCFTYPLEVLKKEAIEFEAVFYNPNIHPYNEFTKRLNTVEDFCKSEGVKLDIIPEYKQELWECCQKEGSSRCFMCYSMRMTKVALLAKQKGFDAFSTTLLVSPYQKHDVIKSLGEKFANEYGIDFYYKDFREGFRFGQNLAREMKLYRQKYCGCMLSIPKSGK